MYTMLNINMNNGIIHRMWTYPLGTSHSYGKSAIFVVVNPNIFVDCWRTYIPNIKLYDILGKSFHNLSIENCLETNIQYKWATPKITIFSGFSLTVRPTIWGCPLKTFKGDDGSPLGKSQIPGYFLAQLQFVARRVQKYYAPRRRRAA